MCSRKVVCVYIMTTSLIVTSHEFEHYLIWKSCWTQVLAKDKYKNINETWNPTKQELGLGCLTPLPTLFQLYRGCQFYWWKKPEYPQKTNDLKSLTNFITYCCIEYTSPWIRNHNIRGNRHGLQLPYNHYHGSSKTKTGKEEPNIIFTWKSLWSSQYWRKKMQTCIIEQIEHHVPK